MLQRLFVLGAAFVWVNCGGGQAQRRDPGRNEAGTPAKVYEHPAAVSTDGSTRFGAYRTENAEDAPPDDGSRGEPGSAKDRRQAIEAEQGRGINWIGDRHPQP